MTPERWREIQQIFEQALDRPEDGRGDWLSHACGGDEALRGEVASLLESERAAAPGFLGAHIQQAVIDLEEAERQAIAGRRVGSYRLIRELGRGGMGAVYLAERADEQYESHVAIKLVRPGLDTDFILRRFRRERQILAHLQHPNIARLLDGGTTDDGVPYIVMEYIEGAWITAYADENHLSVEQKLRLFLPVCDALNYAHRNFIVHRDLKPGNILIGRDGAPKLLDFGVSKLLHTEAANASQTQDVNMMTPDYASPEQIVGDPITLVCDVYSLGAVLYELLTGCRPHRIESCTPLAIERAICLDETQQPSKAARLDRPLSRRLEGDLDNIILRAMQKQPERRYASVEEFAEDIRRHLDYRPIRARPDSAGYRLRKYVRRNRVAVSLSSLVAGSLLAGAAFSTYEARRAQERLQQTRKLATTFVFDVDAAARELPGSMPVRRFIARTELEYLNNLARASSGDQALQRDLAATYQRIGDLQNPDAGKAAMASYRSAESLLRQVLERHPSDPGALLEFLRITRRIGELEVDGGQLDAALSMLREGLARGGAKSENGDISSEVAAIHIDMARCERLSGQLQSGIADANQGVAGMETLAAQGTSDKSARVSLARAYTERAALLSRLDRPQEALENYRRSVELLEKVRDSYPGDYGIALVQSAALLPVARSEEKLAMLNNAQSLLSRVAAVTSDNEGTETLVRALRKLGEEYAASGDRTAALEVSDRLVKVGDALAHQVAAPRAYQATAAVYSRLTVADSDAVLRAADRAAAIQWYERTVAEWRTLELQKDFVPIHKEELAECNQELAKLRTPGRTPKGDGR